MDTTTVKPPLRVSEVARRYDVHRDTVYGWIEHGVTGTDGQTVKLTATQVGGLKMIRRRDLRAFLDALNEHRRDSAKRRRVVERKRVAAAHVEAFRQRAGLAGK